MRWLVHRATPDVAGTEHRVMDFGSTPRHTVTPERPNSGVAPQITVIVLTAGVVGGLFIVVTVFIICKYCVKRKKSPRSPSLDQLPPIGPNRLLTMDSEHKDHERCLDEQEPTETTRLKCSIQQLNESTSPEECYETEEQDDDDEEDEEDERKEGRRVSFQLDNLPPSAAKYLKKGRRYTEGDFHYLKRLRVEKLSGPICKQLSLGSGHSIYNETNMDSKRILSDGSMSEGMGSRGRGGFLMPSVYSVSQQCIEESPSPTSKPTQTEISVEIHCQENEISNTRELCSKGQVRSTSPPGTLGPGPLRMGSSSQSHSMDTVSPINTWQLPDCSSMHVYDDATDYDTLKITEFTRGPFHNTDYDMASDVGSPKVRYNDTGSLEQLDDRHMEYGNNFNHGNNVSNNESDETETLNGTQKYKELWNLRATLEEEEGDCSDTAVRMGDNSADQSPDVGQGASNTTSFESNTEPVAQQVGCCSPASSVRSSRDEKFLLELHCHSSNLLHPNYESRRQTYKDILHRRLQRPNQPLVSGDNSFDSVETVDTDGDVSDTSRQEVTTTSFESTTDNTDSTTESQTGKLRQMKADSGYKSLEAQIPSQNSSFRRSPGHSPGQSPGHSPAGTSPGTSPGHSSCNMEVESTGSARTQIKSTPPTAATPQTSEANAPTTTKFPSPTPDTPVKKHKKTSGSSHFDRRNGKTASKKRREYSRERQVVQLYDSINEPETDSRSDQPSGDSFEESSLSGKLSVFTRFFRAQHREHKERSLSRDYSIDEKSNEIFNQFLRQDPKMEGGFGMRRSPRSHPRYRLTRKHTDPSFYEGNRPDRLSPSARSASLGSDSGASSVRRLSPQDSIEEEYFSEEKPNPDWNESTDKTESKSSESSQPLSMQDIPIIKLPEEDVADA